MVRAALVREVAKLREVVHRRTSALTPLLEVLRRDPAETLQRAGLTPDPWQKALLRSRSRQVLALCTRQAGKSTIGAGLALWQALTEPRSLVLLLSPSLRQSSELFRKVMDHFNALGRPVAASLESGLRLELANGSRVVSLPGSEGTVRGFSGARLLIVDEASRVDDGLYFACRPMLATSQGRLVCLSTPFGSRGWFFAEWSGSGPWQRFKVTAAECPRISPEFLAEEERALGPRWYRQEYFCAFEDPISSVFAQADIAAAMDDGLEPLVLR